MGRRATETGYGMGREMEILMDTSGRASGKGLSEQSVRERAYFIWEQQGKPYGRDREHWAMAERELFTAGMTAGAAAKATGGGAVKAATNGKTAKKMAAATKAPARTKAASKTVATKVPQKRVARTTKSAAKSSAKSVRPEAGA